MRDGCVIYLREIWGFRIGGGVELSLIEDTVEGDMGGQGANTSQGVMGLIGGNQKVGTQVARQMEASRKN